MYEDKRKNKTNNNMNIISIILKVIIAILLIVLSIKLVSVIVENREARVVNNKMDENLKLIDNYARKYINENTIDLNTGDNMVLTIEKLVEEKKLDVIKDENNNKCNLEKSFIQISKLDTEYQIKSYLSCKSSNDYITSFVTLKEEERENVSTTTKVKTTKKTTTSKKVTTKKITTSTKKVTTTTKKTTITVVTTKPVVTTTKVTKPTEPKCTISYNTNGGFEIRETKVNFGTSVKLPTPKKNGYTFYAWYLNNKKVDSDSIVCDTNKVLKAVWSKNE